MCELPVWGNPYVRQVNRQVINKLGAKSVLKYFLYIPLLFSDFLSAPNQ